MFPSRNQVIRDQIHGLVPVDDGLRRIIDTPEIQRMRWIRQTGLAYLVFPCAEHSRFSHSIGAYAVAKRVFARLEALHDDLMISLFPCVSSPEKLAETGKAFAVAALCHDLGHTAFSHALEGILLPTSATPNGKRRHEECTKQLLTRDGELKKRIENYCDFQEVMQIYESTHLVTALSSLVSGQVDVDRCDYLLRDSAAMGVEYGHYDLAWLIHAMSFFIGSDGKCYMALDGARGVDALRQYLSARRAMYRQIYLHATIRAAEKLLKAVFERLQDCPSGAVNKDVIPASLRPLIDNDRTKRQLSLDNFVQTTDLTVMTMVDSLAANSTDDILKYLATAFSKRILPKKVYNSCQFATRSGGTISDDNINDITSIVAKALMGQFADPNEAARYLVFHDRPPPTKQVSLPDLLFSMGNQVHNLDELKGGEADFNFAHLALPISFERLYVPEAARDDVVDYLRNKGLQ